MRPRHAFTLIELIMAIAIGMVIAYAAYAAVRTAAQAVTTCTRLSLQNALMRRGVAAALHEVDFWHSYDDPLDPAAGQKLRATAVDPLPSQYPGETLGLPFTPMRSSPAFARAVTANPPGGEGFDEDERGWDPGYAWSPADPRTWNRGNLAQRTEARYRDGSTGGADPTSWDWNSRLGFGRYGMFTSTLDAPMLSGATWAGAPAAAAGTLAPYSPTPVPVDHHWRDRQVRGLLLTMGVYGAFEYLPPDASMMWYDGDTIPRVGGPIGTMAFYFDHNRGRFAYGTYLSGWSVWTGNSSASLATMVDYHYRQGMGEQSWQTSVWDGRSQIQRSILLQKPEHWPQVWYINSRYLWRGRFHSLCTVRWVNPVTAQLSDLVFSAPGTTLRGARQQRMRDGAGWARWYGPGDPRNDATLDDP